MNKDIPLYYNEDETAFAVLVSPGFGAGWSTWGSHELAYDKRIIEWFLTKDSDWRINVSAFRPNSVKQEAQTFLTQLGYEDVYTGGLGDCILKWVPINAKWRIEEYDGAESLVTEDTEKWW